MNLIISTEIKSKKGYLSINFSPEQRKLIKNKEVYLNEIGRNSDKIYVDKDGNNQLDMQLTLKNKCINLKVIGENHIHKIIELFEEVEAIYCKVIYEQSNMKNRKLINIETLNYVDYTSDSDGN